MFDASDTDVRCFLTYDIKSYYVVFNLCHFTSRNDLFRQPFGVFCDSVKVTSLLKVRILKSP